MIQKSITFLEGFLYSFPLKLLENFKVSLITLEIICLVYKVYNTVRSSFSPLILYFCKVLSNVDCCFFSSTKPKLPLCVICFHIFYARFDALVRVWFLLDVAWMICFSMVSNEWPLTDINCIRLSMYMLEVLDD